MSRWGIYGYYELPAAYESNQHAEWICVLNKNPAVLSSVERGICLTRALKDLNSHLHPVLEDAALESVLQVYRNTVVTHGSLTIYSKATSNRRL